MTRRMSARRHVAHRLCRRAAIVPHRDGGGAYRGSRLPVRRRRLRGDAVRRRPPRRRGAASRRGCDGRCASCSIAGADVATRRLGIVMREVVRRNGVRDGIVYLQVTRGVAPRDHAFPKGGEAGAGRDLAPDSRPRRPAPGDDGIARHHHPRHPLAALRHQDRWRCCPTCSASSRRGRPAPTRPGRSTATAGSPKAPRPTPGSSPPTAQVVTRPADNAILNGVTRLALFDIIAPRRLLRWSSDRSPWPRPRRRARPFSPAPPPMLLPVVRIDGDPVGDGRPGPLSRRLREFYLRARGLGMHELVAIAGDHEAARDPVRLGQHAGRQLGDDPRRAQHSAWQRWRQPLWTIEETRERVRLSLRESFPRHFGERWEEAREIYLDAFAAIHLERLTRVAGRAANAARARRQRHLSGVWSATRPAGCCAGRPTHLGWSALFGSVVGAGDAAADKPARSTRSSGARTERDRARARRSGSSATPRSTWNAPAMPAASRCCSAPARPSRSSRDSRAAPLVRRPRRPVSLCPGACDSAIARPSSDRQLGGFTRAFGGSARVGPTQLQEANGGHPCLRRNRKTCRTCS